MAASDELGEQVGLVTGADEVELWLRGDERPLHSARVAGVASLLVDADSVLTFGEGRVTLVAPSSAPREIAHQATAIARGASGGWLIALQRRALLIGRDGRIDFELGTDVGVTALAVRPGGAAVAIGYENGFIDLTAVSGAPAETPPFEDTPASAVVCLLFGPMQTLCAGFANGTVGMWSLDTGILLHRAQIHGPISTLLLDGAQLIAASELGEALNVDLHVLEQDYASIVAEVSREVRIRWVRGRAERG